MITLTGEEIYRAIPNKYPLMILDSLEIEAGERASGYMRLAPESWYFQCHFPGRPIMPATLLVETMTQVFISTFLTAPGGAAEECARAGNICAWGGDIWREDNIPVLVRIGGFKMKQPLGPGDSVRLDARLHSFRRGIAQGTCEAYKLPQEGPETLVTEFEVTHMVPGKTVAVRREDRK